MDDLIVRQTILGQYRAGIDMLGQAVELCPEELWLSSEYQNRFWHIAYHTVFYVHFYIQPSEAEFKPWAKHRPDANFLGSRPRAEDEPFELPAPYSQRDVQEYLELCRNEVERQIAVVCFEASSGFSWLPFNKLALQFYSIRHLQHPTGQLVDRLQHRGARCCVDGITLTSPLTFIARRGRRGLQDHISRTAAKAAHFL